MYNKFIKIIENVTDLLNSNSVNDIGYNHTGEKFAKDNIKGQNFIGRNVTSIKKMGDLAEKLGNAGRNGDIISAFDSINDAIINRSNTLKEWNALRQRIKKNIVKNIKKNDLIYINVNEELIKQLDLDLNKYSIFDKKDIEFKVISQNKQLYGDPNANFLDKLWGQILCKVNNEKINNFFEKNNIKYLYISYPIEEKQNLVYCKWIDNDLNEITDYKQLYYEVKKLNKNNSYVLINDIKNISSNFIKQFLIDITSNNPIVNNKNFLYKISQISDIISMYPEKITNSAGSKKIFEHLINILKSDNIQNKFDNEKNLNSNINYITLRNYFLKNDPLIDREDHDQNKQMKKYLDKIFYTDFDGNGGFKI